MILRLCGQGRSLMRLRNTRARFRRDAGSGGSSYVGDDMIHVLDIDPRIARRCLRAGRLKQEPSRAAIDAVRISLPS